MRTTAVVNGYNDNGTVGYQTATPDITYGTTNFIVLKLVSTSANNWTGTVWVNPTAGTSSEPTASGTITGIVCNGGIQNMAYVNRQGGGNSLTFDEVRVATTWADAVSYVPPPPSVPTGLGATAGTNSVALSWTASTGGPTSYNVKRSTSSGSGYVTVSTAGAVTGTSYTDAASSGTTYYYVVSAVNASGESANSSETNAAPIAGLPTAPTGLTTTANSTSITLNWTAAAGSPTSYNVYRSTTSGSGYAAISTPGAVTTTTFTDSAASPGTTYYYVVTAVNSYGEGANSSQASGAVSAAGPIAYDSMSYSGAQVNTGNTAPTGTPTTTTSGGFTGNWAGGALTYSSTSMTYASLPTAGGSVSALGANNLYETVASAPASGSVYVSFLYKFSGTPGGNRNGIIFENSAGTGVMFSYQQNGSSAYPCLVTMSSINTVGTQLTPNSTTLRVAASTHLYVLKFNYTAGVVSSINVYSDPTAGQGTAPTADFTVTSGLPSFGALSKIGMANPTADPIAYDEVRVGTSFGAVVGLAGPSITTGLTATGTNNAVNLSWNAAANATSYNVLRSTVSGLEQPLTNGLTGTTFSDTTAVNGTNYYYVVQSVNGLGGSAFSTEQSATPVAPPAAPTGLGATPGVNTVALSWTASTGATGYNVKRSNTSGSGYAILAAGTNVSGSPFTDSSAIGGNTYYYVVSAVNAGGESANSSETNATPTIAAPSAPGSLVATPSSGSVGLAWTAGTGAASYNVYRSITSGSGYGVISTPGAVTGTSYTDTTTANGTIYYFKVTSTNSAGESAAAGPATAAMPPAAPTGLGATAGSNQVALSWTASAGTSGAVSYNVKRSTTSGSGYTTISTSGAVTGTSYTDLTALSGTTYYYVVSGVNASGEGVNSSPEQSATPTGAPQAPTGLTTTANSTSITLNWTAALGAPASYNVKRSTTSGSGYAALTTPGAQTTTSFTDTGASPGTTYYYVVSAVNIYGESANSSQASGATIPASASVNESFNYSSLTTGTPSTGTGETGNWTCSSTPAIVSGLTYSTLPVTNNALSVNGQNASVNLAGSTASGTVYVRFLFSQNTNANNGNNGGNASGLELVDSSGNGIVVGQTGGYSGTAGNFGVNNVASGVIGSQLFTSTSGNDVYGNTYLLVVELTGSGSGWTGNFWVNPPLNTTSPGTPTGTFSASQFTMSALDAIVNGGGNADVFDEIQVGSSYGAVSGVAAPITPTGFTATAGNNLVNLNWSAASGADSYTVLRSTTSGLEQSLTTGVTGTTYTDSTAVNGTTYYYVVQSVNAAGGSAFSTEQSATPTASTSGSTNAQLSSLVLTPAGTLSPAFDTGTTSYTATNTCANNPVTVTVINADLTATNWLVYNGTTNQLASGASSSPLTLVVGVNPVTVQVVSQDLSQTNNYTVAATLTASPTVSVNSATIYVGGSATLTATTSASSPGYLWSDSETTASITVSPAATTNYTVIVTDATTGCAGGGSGTVTVLLNTNALLATLSISPGVLSQTFISGTTNYTATNSYGQNPVTVTATSVDTNATLALSFTNGAYGAAVTKSLSVSGNNLGLNPPVNTVAVRVVSQDQSQTNVYTVNVLLQPSQTVPKLTNSVSGSTLNLSWAADHLGYTLLTQTNNLNKGVSSVASDWGPVAGSTTTNSMSITIIKTGVTNAYYRLAYP